MNGDAQPLTPEAIIGDVLEFAAGILVPAEYSALSAILVTLAEKGLHDALRPRFAISGFDVAELKE